MDTLPTYKIKINPDSDKGVYMISLVNEPAIERNFFKLSKIPLEFHFTGNSDKGQLYGPLLIPDLKIYRKIGNEEFNIVFDKETIEIIANKFNKNKLGDALNFMHSDKEVKGYMLENWIIEDKENDKSTKYVNHLPEGTWFGKFQIEDKKFWDEYVKTEKVKGFSVEIDVDNLELINLNKTKNKHVIMSKKIKLEDVMSIIEEIKSDVNQEVTVEEVIAIIEEKVESIAEEIVDEVKEEVKEEVQSEEVQLAEEGTETSTVEDVIVEEGKSVEQQVMDLINPIIEKYDAQLETIMSKLNELESKMVIESEPSEEVVELKKEVIELKSLISSTPATKSVDTKIQAKEDAMKQKLSFFQNIKK